MIALVAASSNEEVWLMASQSGFASSGKKSFMGQRCGSVPRHPSSWGPSFEKEYFRRLLWRFSLITGESAFWNHLEKYLLANWQAVQLAIVAIASGCWQNDALLNLRSRLPPWLNRWGRWCCVTSIFQVRSSAWSAPKVAVVFRAHVLYFHAIWRPWW